MENFVNNKGTIHENEYKKKIKPILHIEVVQNNSRFGSEFCHKPCTILTNH